MAQEQEYGQNMKSIAIYDIEDKPPLGEAVPLGIQHVLAMFLGNVAPPLIIAGALGLATGETTFLVQMALIIAGVGTIIQAYPLGPIGARVPIVMGTSFAFLGPLIGIGAEYGLAAVFGACLAAAPVEGVIGYYLKHVRPYFPPLVSGVVVMLIGLSLIPVGMDYAAGGVGAEDYGSFQNLGLAGLVFFVTIILNQFFSGFLRIASVLIGIVVGYIVAIPMGMIDFTQVAEAGWITVPAPLAFGMEFHLGAILTVAFIYVITAMETIGDISGTVAATGRDASSDELRGGILADSAVSALAAVFNAFPNTSYSQNVGLVNFTGVASRYVAAIGGVFLILLGFVPKFGALVAVMPDPVLGGGALVLFALILGAGMRLIAENCQLGHRNITIISVAVALGLAVDLREDALQHLPEDLQIFFGSALIMGGFAVLIMNVLIPGGGVGTGPHDYSDGLPLHKRQRLDDDPPAEEKDDVDSG